MTKKTIFEYSDFKNPFLKVTVIDGSGQSRELLIKFSQFELDNGVILDTDAVVGRIKSQFDRIYPVELLLSCEEIYKSVFSLPKTNHFRAEAAYRKQLREMQRDDYTVITDYYVHSIGCVYNSYFVPNQIVNCLKKIAHDLNTHTETVRLFGMHLKEQLNFKKDYVYFYVRDSLCRMLLVVENKLITEYDFTFEDSSDIRRVFLMVAAKHEFEFERKNIQYYGVDSNVPLELNLGLKRVELDDEKPAPLEGIEVEYDDPLEEINTKPTTFEERLAECQDYVRERYQKLSSEICSYNGVTCQVSKICATFSQGGKILIKIDIDKKGEGRRVSVYFAEEPEDFVNRKVQFAISKKQNFEATPCLFRISTNSRFNLARQTIKNFLTDNGIEQKSEKKQK